MPDVAVEKHGFQAKWYLNGFPKSGLHAVAAGILPVAKPMIEDDLWTRPWAGPYDNNSWTTDWVPLERLLYKISRLQDGHFLKGHCGYKDEVERFLWYSGISHVFIYRDPRDVAVSQSYHVTTTDDDHFAHPNKELYRKLGSHEAVLKAVITGYDMFPGVMERWEEYAPWLDVEWVHKVKYEDLIYDTEKTYEKLLVYGLSRVAPLFDRKLKVVDTAFKYIVMLMEDAMNAKKYSPTYRKGVTGDWKEEFTPEIAEAFAESDKNNWLVRLGYETDPGWWRNAF